MLKNTALLLALVLGAWVIAIVLVISAVNSMGILLLLGCIAIGAGVGLRKTPEEK